MVEADLRQPRRRLRRWLLAVAIGVDVLANAIMGGLPHETISHRLGRARQHGSVVAAVLCIPLNLISRDHCSTVTE